MNDIGTKLRNGAAAACLVASLAAVLPAGASDKTSIPEPTAETRGRYGIARVIDVTPIVRVVRISEPQRRCWDEDYIVRVEPDSHRGTAGSAILGGIIGGAVGHAFGRGSGRDTATVAGVLIGSAIGHDRAVERNDRYASGGREETRTRTHCTVDDSYREEERIEGYDVTYEYQGDRYRTRMSYDPGRELKVWVSVRPVSD